MNLATEPLDLARICEWTKLPICLSRLMGLRFQRIVAGEVSTKCGKNQTTPCTSHSFLYGCTMKLK